VLFVKIIYKKHNYHGNKTAAKHQGRPGKAPGISFQNIIGHPATCFEHNAEKLFSFFLSTSSFMLTNIVILLI